MKHSFLKLSVLLLIFLILQGSENMTIAQNTFIAHRGASYRAPENTLASVQLAWELGAGAVEVDVYLSADNRVVVIHDKTTKRTSGGQTNYKVAKTTSEILCGVDVGAYKSDKYAGEKIPYIEEIIETVPKGRTLVVEIKCGTEILPALEKAIEKSGKKDQIVFISFGWKTILETQKVFPENKCYYLKMFSAGLSRRMKLAAKNGLTGVNLNHKIINQRIVREANELGLEVMAWTVDEPSEARRLIGLGVTKLTTNRPKWLKEQMEK